LLAAAIDDQTLLGEILDCLANIFIGYDFGEFGFHINCPLLLWVWIAIGSQTVDHGWYRPIPSNHSQLNTIAKAKRIL
jgi:hypothetical protein